MKRFFRKKHNNKGPSSLPAAAAAAAASGESRNAGNDNSNTSKKTKNSVKKQSSILLCKSSPPTNPQTKKQANQNKKKDTKCAKRIVADTAQSTQRIQHDNPQTLSPKSQAKNLGKLMDDIAKKVEACDKKLVGYKLELDKAKNAQIQHKMQEIQDQAKRVLQHKRNLRRQTDSLMAQKRMMDMLS